jgi:hypothetical protein
LSNQHTDHGASPNGNLFTGKRELRSSHITGMLSPLSSPSPVIGTDRNGYGSGGFDFEQMVHSLHDLFEQDRQIASQSDATRCGICYLHFSVGELRYRDEGFYVCPNCTQHLGHQPLPMLRKQQKL